MEKFYKISESELLELLTNSIKLSCLESAGVDKCWDDGGMAYKSFKRACAEAELPSDEEGEYWDYSYRDLARFYLMSDYPEIKE